MAVDNMQMVKACVMCPTLQEEPIEQVNVACGFPRQPQSMIPIQARITRDGGITPILAMGIHK